jgi:hypothetical protein
MSVFPGLVATVGAAAVVVALASPAAAQGGSTSRPYRGLFAGGTSEPSHALSVNGSAASGYDTNVLADSADASFAAAPATPRPPASVYAALSGGLSYSLNAKGIGVGASLSSSVRRYSQLRDLVVGGVSGSLGASFTLTSRTIFTVGQAIASQPALMAMPFVPVGEASLGQVASPDVDFLAVRVNYLSYVTSAGISQQLSRRASMSAGYSRQVSDLAVGSGFESQSGWARFSRNLTRDLGLRLGYGYTEARYGGDLGRYQRHTIDSGVDYSRALSLSRRTRLAFSSGAAALNERQRTQYTVTGNATLSHQIGRSWDTGVTYTRNVGFAESLRRPYFFDGVNGSIQGLIARRLSFNAGAGATIGDFGSATTRDLDVASDGEGDDGFASWYASSALNTAISRHLAIGVAYTFYDYSLPAPVLVVEGSPSHVRRHSVRVSLNAWAPIFERGRRANASR